MTDTETISSPAPPPTSPLFPRYVWWFLLIIGWQVSHYMARHFMEQQRPQAKELVGRVIDIQLRHYGAMSESWNGDDLSKYDV